MRLHQIKILSLGLGLLAPMLLVAAPQADLVVARYHFLGGDQLVADPNAAKLKQIGAMPSTADFRDRVARKGAVELAHSLGKQLNPAGSGQAAFLHPLLIDLMECESVGVFGGRPEAPLGFVVAIKVTPQQAKLWQDNLGKVVGAPAESIKAEGFQGQSWKKAGLRVIPVKDWLVISRGDDLLAQQTEILTNLGKQGRPAAALQTNWFEADADWPRLASWLPLQSCPFKLARTQVSLSSKSDIIRTTVRVKYPGAIQWKSKPWTIPTELIRDPLVSFTAAQELAPFLAPTPSLAKFKVDPWNQQFYVWAISAGIPFQTFGAIPVQNVTNVVQDLIVQVPQTFNSSLKQMRAGSFAELTNHHGLIWEGLMPLAPAIRPGAEKAGEFLKLEFFAAPPQKLTQPAPPELFAQITGRTNLVYYDWELTEKRISQWRPMAQLLPILRPVFDTNGNGADPLLLPAPPTVNTGTNAGKMVSARSAREAWLTDISPLLGNSITEVTQTGPNEVNLLRKSPLGFTGFELVVLSDWLTGARHVYMSGKPGGVGAPPMMAPGAAPSASTPARAVPPKSPAPVTTPKK